LYDTAGSTDKTLKLYERHVADASHQRIKHDLLNDIGREVVIADIKGWIDARLSAE
jgi:acylglycerol lipase